MKSQKPILVLNAKNSTGAGNSIDVEDSRHPVLVIATSGMGAGDTITVKVQGSIMTDPVDFDAAKSVSNLWDYVACKDMENGADIEGAIGLTFSGANDVKMLAVNVDGMKWLTLNITTISDTTNTSVTAYLKSFNDV